MQFNFSTWLTIFRIILIPFLVLFFYLPVFWAKFFCITLFIFSALTDLLDGFIARILKQTTKFGTFLDPLADKLTVTTTLIIIIEKYHIWWITIPSTIIITREIFISSLRGWVSKIKKNIFLYVSLIGKIKTTTQMISITGFLWNPNFQIEIISIILLYIASILSFWSMIKYLFSVWKILEKNF